MTARVRSGRVRTRSAATTLHNKELRFILGRFTEIYEGNPSFGRCAVQILAPVTDELAFQKWQGLSIHDAVWRMISWREHLLELLQQKQQLELQYTDPFDWRLMRYRDKTMWQMLLDRLQTTQDNLENFFLKWGDEILEKRAAGQEKNFRQLLHNVLDNHVHCLAQVQLFHQVLMHSR